MSDPRLGRYGVVRGGPVEKTGDAYSKHSTVYIVRWPQLAPLGTVQFTSEPASACWSEQKSGGWKAIDPVLRLAAVFCDKVTSESLRGVHSELVTEQITVTPGL